MCPEDIAFFISTRDSTACSSSTPAVSRLLLYLVERCGKSVEVHVLIDGHLPLVALVLRVAHYPHPRTPLRKRVSKAVLRSVPDAAVDRLLPYAVLVLPLELESGFTYFRTIIAHAAELVKSSVCGYCGMSRRTLSFIFAFCIFEIIECAIAFALAFAPPSFSSLSSFDFALVIFFSMESTP